MGFARYAPRRSCTARRVPTALAMSAVGRRQDWETEETMKGETLPEPPRPLEPIGDV
jgi:hypothetical protein